MKKVLYLLLIIILTGCGNKQEEQPSVIVNQNISIQEEKQIDSLVFNNISIIYKDNLSVITFQITNEAIEKNIDNIYISVKNESGNIITDLKINCDQKIKQQEKKLFSAASDIDLTTAYYLDFKID